MRGISLYYKDSLILDTHIHLLTKKYRSYLYDKHKVISNSCFHFYHYISLNIIHCAFMSKSRGV